jgi:hypothetical protein
VSSGRRGVAGKWWKYPAIAFVLAGCEGASESVLAVADGSSCPRGPCDAGPDGSDAGPRRGPIRNDAGPRDAGDRDSSWDYFDAGHEYDGYLVAFDSGPPDAGEDADYLWK